MKKMLRKIVKWLLRIIGGVLALVFLVLIVFYVFRSSIKDKALDFANEAQAGTVYLNKINLRPFMDFPAVAVQLKDLQYSTGLSGLAEQDSLPILRMEDIFVSLDLFQLMKGVYKVNRIRLGEGEINFHIGVDSVSNIEKALGISFAASDESIDTTQNDSMAIAFDMENLQIRNLKLHFLDESSQMEVLAHINGLQSSFSYFPEQITANLGFDLNLDKAEVGTIILDKPRSISFGSSLIYDQQENIVTLERSLIDLKDAMIEMEADVWLEDKLIDMQFNARNEGIELLNFLLSGVLDMNAIEQIGEGAIALDGMINGSYDGALPKVEMNILASDLGFHITDLGEDVTDIGFQAYVRNGEMSDLSDAKVVLNDFHVSLPDGNLDVNLEAYNLKTPELKLIIDAHADLAVLNEIIQTEQLSDMQGKVAIQANIEGRIDRAKNEFLDNAGELLVQLEDVSVQIPEHELQDLDGLVYVAGRSLGLRDLTIVFDSIPLQMELELENVLPAYFDFPGDVGAFLRLSAEEIPVDDLLKDTLLGGPVEDLELSVNVETSLKQLLRDLENGNIPSARIELNDMKMTLPNYGPIEDLDVLLNVRPDRVSLSKLHLVKGRSMLDIKAMADNYKAFLAKDSLEELRASLEMRSQGIVLSEILTYDSEFMYLPEEFAEEEIQELSFKVNIETTISELLKNNGIPNFSAKLIDLGLRLKNYPNTLSDINIDIRLKDSLVQLNKLEGRVGESNFLVKASAYHLLDSGKDISGNALIVSDLLDVESLMDYPLLFGTEGDGGVEDLEEAGVIIDSVEQKGSLGLELIDYPGFDLGINIGEIRYAGNVLYDINGNVSTDPSKVLTLDEFGIKAPSGGTIVLTGELDVSDSLNYVLTSTFDIDTVDLSDFDFELAMGEESYSLQDNFNGVLSASGIAEVLVFSNGNIDLENSAAAFNLLLEDGRVRNFTPLQAASRYTGNKDLNDIKFGELNNSFTMVDGRIIIPTMDINTSLDVILVEGEQGFGADFLYLVRIPKKLIGTTAWATITNQAKRDKEKISEVEDLKQQTYVVLTVFGKGEDFDVKLGDKRDKYLSVD